MPPAAQPDGEGDTVIRCTRCCIPDTRPDTYFDDAGVCSACLTAERAQQANAAADWGARKRKLADLLETHGSRVTGAEFDCIVPSSGGKDSTAQVVALRDLGAKVLVVTATTCHLTRLGRANIDNLARLATTIEVTPDRSVRAKLNRLGLRIVGDISWPEHVSIFTTPFKVAAMLGIPLIFYGENPQAAYGGPPGTDEALTMTRRWVSEFGGFNGLRPQDMIGQDGITAADMAPYMLTNAERDWCTTQAQAHFLGQYLGWDSHANALTACRNGFTFHIPSRANYWPHENLDNAQTGIHDHMMFRKYGYGRACAQVSVDVRNGVMGREQAMQIVLERDGILPMVYADVPLSVALDRISMTFDELAAVMDDFTSWEAVVASRTKAAQEMVGLRV